jgi:hypothetical protein
MGQGGLHACPATSLSSPWVAFIVARKRNCRGEEIPPVLRRLREKGSLCVKEQELDCQAKAEDSDPDECGLGHEVLLEKG